MLRSIKCPIDQDGFPEGLPRPLEAIRNVTDSFAMPCPACGRIYRPRLNDLKRLKCLTCGCTNNVVSGQNLQLAEFIRGLGFTPIQEHPIGGKVFDLYVPEASLLVELQGIRWHSKPGSAEREGAKYEIAKASGSTSLWIYEDEWKHRRRAIESIVAHKLGIKPDFRLRPKSCDIRLVTSSEANALYDEFHYIGRCASPFNIAAFYDGQMVAAMSFRKPSRQSKHSYEMSRMVMRPRFRIHGIWSKFMAEFRATHPHSSIVAYSDNRLFDGHTYRAIGFTYDGDVKRDYYWARGGHRYHKSALRKSAGCVVTENALRTSQGFAKIWDLGKKRWILASTPA
jgi:hypothetical protein